MELPCLDPRPSFQCGSSTEPAEIIPSTGSLSTQTSHLGSEVVALGNLVVTVAMAVSLAIMVMTSGIWTILGTSHLSASISPVSLKQ